MVLRSQNIFGGRSIISDIYSSNRTVTSMTLSTDIIAVIIAGIFIISTAAPSIVYGATNCTATYGEDCYAAGMYDFYSTVQSLGAGVKQKVQYPSNTVGHMVSPLWVRLTDDRLLEIGWIASSSYTPKWYWALDGYIQKRWCTNNACPSNNSTWLFTISDSDRDGRWILRVGTDTITTNNLGNATVKRTGAGYEIGYYDTNPGINDYSGFMYYKPSTGWVLLSSAVASKWYVVVPVNGYTVDYYDDAPFTHFMVAKGGGRNLC